MQTVLVLLETGMMRILLATMAPSRFLNSSDLVSTFPRMIYK